MVLGFSLGQGLGDRDVLNLQLGTGHHPIPTSVSCPHLAN